MGKLLCIFLTLVVLQLAYGQITPRIVGGRPISITRRKYMIILRQGGRFICGGSLITPRHVITAAHCIVGSSVNSFTVNAGTGKLSGGGQTVRVSKIFHIKSFTLKVLQNDIAVLKLAKSLTGSNISTIKLCNSRMKAGAGLRVSGWGVQSQNANLPPNQLRTVLVPVVRKSKCRSDYSGQAKLTNSMMCAAKLGRDSCSGDSGGPAVHAGRLCGVVSWGFGCARPDFPGVYTNINKMKKFIRAVIRK